VCGEWAAWKASKQASSSNKKGFVSSVQTNLTAKRCIFSVAKTYSFALVSTGGEWREAENEKVYG